MVNRLSRDVGMGGFQATTTCIMPTEQRSCLMSSTKTSRTHAHAQPSPPGGTSADLVPSSSDTSGSDSGPGPASCDIFRILSMLLKVPVCRQYGPENHLLAFPWLARRL